MSELNAMTTVVGAVGAYISKDAVKDLLGPTAEYIGGELKGLVEKCNINLNDIFKRARKKVGENINKPGAVNARILRQIMNEGRFCEEDIARDYVAGVLAGSRSELQDDRGLTFIHLVVGLSSSQIRAHYIFYNIFRQLYEGSGYKVTLKNGRDCLKTFIPQMVFNHAMGFKSDKFNLMWPHIAYGLQREELITFHG